MAGLHVKQASSLSTEIVKRSLRCLPKILLILQKRRSIRAAATCSFPAVRIQPLMQFGLLRRAQSNAIVDAVERLR